jgi:hypothetical protein
MTVSLGIYYVNVLARQILEEARSSLLSCALFYLFELTRASFIAASFVLCTMLDAHSSFDDMSCTSITAASFEADTTQIITLHYIIIFIVHHLYKS